MSRGQRILEHDPTAATAVHLPDDRFIPLRPDDLGLALSRDGASFGPDAPRLRAVFETMRSILEQEADRFEKALAAQYAAFSPDRDTLLLDDVSAARSAERFASLLARLDYLLEKANFEPLSDVQLDQFVCMANTRGLRVRLHTDRIDYLKLWVRGRGEREQLVRTWRHPIRGELRRAPVCRRLALVARLKGDPHVLLKLFKDIPASDVEALLPHAEVAMTWLDQLRVIGSGAGALSSTVFKLVQIVIAGVVIATQVLWLLVVGLSLLLWRTFWGYRAARIKRDHQRTRNLYFLNLDNNEGVIHALVAMVAHEDLKEAMLTYAFCHAAAQPPTTAEELRDRIERYLHERFEARVQFDIDDGLRTLDRLGLWRDRARFRVLEPAWALVRLHDHCEQRRSENHHEQRIDGAHTDAACSVPVSSTDP